MLPLPSSFQYLVPINLVTVEILDQTGRHRTFRGFTVPIDRHNNFTDFTEVLTFIEHWSTLYPDHTLILHFCNIL